jgi:UDP-N-acetylglucosamine 3-dehydrogenase
MGSPLKVAVIGLGVWGEKHVQALKANADAEVVSVCDSAEGRAKAIASRYGVARPYTSFHEMLEKERLDAVHVVTPEPAHREPVVEALSRSIPVLVEKPLATNLEDADAMIRESERTKTTFMVGHILRWDTRYAMVKDSIARGDLGRIATISARRSVVRAEAPTFLVRSTPVMQLGIHDIDLILWYTGYRVTRAYCVSSRLFSFKYPDCTTSILEFEEGGHAVLQNSFSLPDSMPYPVGARMEIVSQRTYTVIDVSQQALFIADEKGYRIPDTTLIPVVRDEMGGTLGREVDYFVRCVVSGRRPSVISPQDSREALRVALACESSMREGKPCDL